MPQRRKKPGPKRDSKPAPSEKLERNRQAQRTHRERKEQYTKDLELEVMRLKELFTQTAQERDAAFQARDAIAHERDQLREEVLRLKEIVQISTSSSGTDSGYDGISITCDATRNSSLSTSNGYHGLLANAPLQEVTANNAYTERQESVWELSEAHGFASDGASYQEPTIKNEQQIRREEPTKTLQLMRELAPRGVDYDELGIDFVLTLEKPCMGHIQYLHVRAHNFQTADGEMPGRPMEVPDDGENQHISGHTLMATAPTYSHIMDSPASKFPAQMPQVKRPDLLQLLNLSNQLQVNEIEVPPVRAWIKLMQDERMKLLSVNDIAMLKEKLLRKVHCYRFGAVIDENDIDETLQEVVNTRQAAVVASTSPPRPMKIESL
ncbi:uncharacterized protein MYCFIDRAFT_89771 [Pseudocercospora fijiensis CIRAD86]|uniref:BZIP domain-containing protein n=1 Tax=Pseudocercospora fijiensis (strain CIRAD86) TaxID=383855 RepID=M2ZAU9_PSEFD|nr:uncharacterized protein MYCFIDRAFT_89771 [Pseudocercospora fijiensis CIRAD86]EME86965.1 hypothetical protein MYCFIDRAFT_89771 [Pseudocercospora fijiensis CIRAD86]